VIYGPHYASASQYIGTRGLRFEYVILSRRDIAADYLEAVRTSCPGAKVIFDTVDLHFIRERRQAQLKNDPLMMRRSKQSERTEMRIARSADIVLTVTPKERDILLSEIPGLSVQVVSDIQDPRRVVTAFSQRSSLLFVGGFMHPPNVDSAVYLVRSLFPIIRELLPGIRLYIVGSDPPPAVQALQAQDVVVTGYVDRIDPYFDDARVFVAPIRFGAGVKGKIVNSMSRGLPVVTTQLGVEGMSLKDGEDVFIADDPIQFAQQVARLYNNELLWMKLSSNAVRVVENHYSSRVAKEALVEIFAGPGRQGSMFQPAEAYGMIPADYRRAEEEHRSQTMEAKQGEIAFRQQASFGEPDKVLKMCRQRIKERASTFKKLRESGIELSPCLEIGAERGQSSLYLANKWNCVTVALDISKASLLVAPRVQKDMGYHKSSHLVCADALQLPFAAESFNLVCCFQTLHHFTYLGDLFEEIRRVLRPGGHFFFAEEGCRDDESIPLWPDPDNVDELRYGIIENVFTQKTWLQEMGRFTVVSTSYSQPLYEGTRHISALLRKDKP
jgi:glycosyltransferase involved in cell wall biosynthesis/ubiquinone/menaquinone biosynthesis C-methylase UbiE